MIEITPIIQLARQYEHKLPEAPARLPVPLGGDIARWIDHTILKPEATDEQVIKICNEAIEYGFAAVCVNPIHIGRVSGLLAHSSVVPCCVVGFPLGATSPEVKTMEALYSISQGAREIDVVIDVGGLKSGQYERVYRDIAAVTSMVKSQGALIKVIIETCLLSPFEKIMVCLLCAQAGVDFVKTSTGFNTAGATVEDVALMYRLVGAKCRVKAAGGIRSYTDAIAMIRAGASRLGTSAGVQILKESEHERTKA